MNKLSLTAGTAIAALTTFAGSAIAQPVINTIISPRGSTAGGDLIYLGGVFPAGTPQVLIDGAPATIQSNSNTEIICLTPAGQGNNAAVQVVIAGQPSNFVHYIYDIPKVTGLSASNGPTNGGISITINGQNFGTNPAATIGGATVVRTSFGHTFFTGLLPAGQGLNQPVIVTAAGQTNQTTPIAFNYNAPGISNIAPNTFLPTAGSTNVVIAGTNLGSTPVVRIGTQSISAIPGSVTPTQFAFVLPAGAGLNQQLFVTVAGQNSNVLTFSYAPPVINLLSQVDGPTSGQTMVTMLGSNLGPAATAQIFFGGQQVAVQPGSPGHSSLGFLTPPGEGTNHAVVVVAGGQTSPQRFFSYLPPLVTSILPSNVSVNGGDLLQLSGTSFGLNPVVLIDGSPATIVASSHTSITCRAPAHVAGHVAVSVVAAGQGSNSVFADYICDADFNADGSVDFFDYLDFVDRYSIGC